MIRGAARTQSTNSRTSWKVQVKWHHQKCSQCPIDKFTYFLERRNRDGIVRGAVGAQSTSSRTIWKCASGMESSEVRSVLNKQIHVLAGNAQARWNCQRHGQCSINDFTYQLEMHKQDGTIRGTVSAQSTTSHTSWKCTSKIEPSEEIGRAHV